MKTWIDIFLSKQVFFFNSLLATKLTTDEGYIIYNSLTLSLEKKSYQKYNFLEKIY